MIGKMMSSAQKHAYECVRTNTNNKALAAACLARQAVGKNEQIAIDQATNCFKQYGRELDKYPLCMAEQIFNENTAAAMGCLSDQLNSDQATPWTIASCITQSLLPMNAETSVAIECAMVSSGEPMTFVSCAGGQLTAMELRKCFTVGVGGNGCFGENNTIIKGLKAIGLDTTNITNPNGALVNAWNTAFNDIRHGPGANNDIIRAINTVNHDIKNGLGKGNDIRKFAKKIGLGGIFGD